MTKNIVIFTDYFMDGVVDLVESSSLSVSLTAVGSYQALIKTVSETPNLIGVLLIDYVATTKTFDFYKKVCHMMDTIATSLQAPLTLSVLHRSRHIPNYLQRIKTKNINISVCKYTSMTEEVIRLDGLVPILAKGLGIIRTVEPKHFVVSQEANEVQSRDRMISALTYCLSEDPNDSVLQVYFYQFPELRTIYSLKFDNKNDAECIKLYKDTYIGIFCQLLIEVRERGYKAIV